MRLPPPPLPTLDHRRPGASLIHVSDSLESVADVVLTGKSPEQQKLIVADFIEGLRARGHSIPTVTSTPYINTIPPDEQPEYPGDIAVERLLKSYIRWNAMAMVVKANSGNLGVGGHISTYASLATLYEVGFNHFFRGGDEGIADMIYFQGHASPGNYARSYLEYRLDDQHLLNFRQELDTHPGLSSYPHPYLMPDYWQFPTVSMGLGPISSIYQARYSRYLQHRGLIKTDREPKVWCFIGDGESDEPETLGQIAVAGREGLDNLIWVVNCNLQRLDGPVRGNGKIIQELEGLFRGAGWNVIKVIWGGDWDDLLAKDRSGLLVKRMEEVVDGEYQKYIVEPGSHIRKHFFGKYPELLRLVDHLTDDQLKRLMRGGHDTNKVYAAYEFATNRAQGRPTVILAKTVKGYGLGEAGEGRNPSHQQKKLNERELREFRGRFKVPIEDDVIADMPFYRPAKDSAETQYLLARRQALGGFLPRRETKAPQLNVPVAQDFTQLTKGMRGASTTKAFVLLLSSLLRHKELGKLVVPIVPDEARTFGMDGLFSEIGIYSSKGQLYDPVDRSNATYYRESKTGQLLEEGINEAGSMASFVAAGTAYSNFGVPTIPFYIYYSMFGFQRVGDQIWLAGDSRCRGFLLGATSGRTALNGEGLQHQDAHSHLVAGTVPNLMAYEPAYGYELAVIIADGLKRMYQDAENVFYYISLHNEDYSHPALPEDPAVADGILQGMYKLKPGAEGLKHKAQLLGSGCILLQALRAQQLLEPYGVSADVWSVTSYKRLRSDALATERWNMFHPTETPRVSFLEKTVAGRPGPWIAVSDNLKLVADQIAPWIPGGLTSLGTDGFGRSDSRSKLRRFFEVDAECTAIGVLYALAKKGELPPATVAKAIRDLGVDPEKAFGLCV
ncbi:MAG TPA: pyruvate dehydrogenase (acetyl-transferring), homodimeric type [Verrucomicrobiota bacterium]|nr:pyruvate dehydrogenase (acetyl-transferring), homodimeric type [Verrucomicrobiales bacterium]HRI12248.1 pyruvate dehydrogenase (acetyl-transferring), homodimeric type [Verrucomicrobiota bacterium]